MIWRKKWTQKNLLQPLPALASAFLVFQSLFCFSPLFLFSSASFSFQFLRLFFLVLHFFLVSAPFLLLFNAPFFFSVDALPFFSPKYLFSAQNVFQSKNLSSSLQFMCASLLRWSQTACLKTKRDPLFMPILKPKKKNSFFNLHSSKTQYSL